METAREYRRRHIPLDCVVQDWNTWKPGEWGNKRPDKSRYPDIAAANRELHDMNVHSMISLWPNARSGEDHDEFEAAGCLLEDKATYNAFDREARKLYWKQVKRELYSGGFDSWWCDSTEPFWFWQGDFEDGVQDPGYRELYLRWLQLGCFLPLFRSHGTDTPREIWNFGAPGEPFYDAIERFIRLRYRLMPYIYSLAAMVSFDDYTMPRSLLFDFGGDKRARTIADEFMFGPAFLVCPVTKPFRFGPGGVPLNKKEEWPCYLPEGAPWHDFWTGEVHRGGKEITVPAPPGRMPLFVRAGSIVPAETAPIEYADQITGEPLEIRVYPGADGSFSLYEDSGDGYDYETGRRNRVNLEWNDRDRILTIGPAGYGFPRSILNRLWTIRAGNTQREVPYTGKPLRLKLET